MCLNSKKVYFGGRTRAFRQKQGGKSMHIGMWLKAEGVHDAAAKAQSRSNRLKVQVLTPARGHMRKLETQVRKPGWQCHCRGMNPSLVS